MNCSTLNVGTSNRKKRKFAELNTEKDEDKDCVPTPKWTNVCVLIISNNYNI